MNQVSQIPNLVLELVRNAGDLLVLEIIPHDQIRTPLGYDVTNELNNAQISKGKVFLTLLWPKDLDFSAWPEHIVKAEEMLDVCENQERIEKESTEQYNAFMGALNKAK